MPEPEQKPQTFEKALESDIARLAEQVRTQRERPELKNASEQEILKEAIRAFPEQGPERGAPASAASPPPAPQAVQNQSPLPDYAANAPAEVKLEIEYLLDVALRQGIGKALAEAGKSPYFVQDALHDALAGKLYPELRRRGIVK